MIDGDELERSYKHHLSDYAEWEQRDHASNWMLIEDNLGENLSIDETMLQEDLVTILSNKAGHCKQGSVISIVRGTKAEDVIEVLMKILFQEEPKLKEAYDIVNGLRSIFRSKTLDKEAAKVKLHDWYETATRCSLREIKSARDAIKSREDEVLNYFINHSTNAGAESLNSKIKTFRSQLRGVSDYTFFMYRIYKIFG